MNTIAGIVRTPGVPRGVPRSAGMQGRLPIIRIARAGRRLEAPVGVSIDVTRALPSFAALVAAALLAALAGAGAGAPQARPQPGTRTEVVVQLAAPPLARARGVVGAARHLDGAAAALHGGTPRDDPGGDRPLAVSAGRQRAGGRRSARRASTALAPPRREAGLRRRHLQRRSPAPMRPPSARGTCPARRSGTPAPGSRSGSSTTASTRSTRSSTRPGTRCPRASRRARPRTRRPR